MTSQRLPVACVARALEAAAHMLPAQGPITVFVHHNPLHAFEHLPFEQAVLVGGRRLGCEPYLAEEDYRAAWQRGRITPAALEAVLDAELADDDDALLLDDLRERDLLRALLLHGVPPARGRLLRWLLEEREARRVLRSDVPAAARRRLLADSDDEALAVDGLWRACLALVARVPAPPAGDAEPPVRLCDLLLSVHSIDVDEQVHPLMIRLAAAFLDQGVAYWAMPEREHGFFAAVVALYGDARLPPPQPWSRGLVALLAAEASAERDALASIRASLEALGIAEPEVEPFLVASALAMRGWAGMMRQVESRPDRVPVHAPPASLADFVAVRLLAERAALEQQARALGHRGDLALLRRVLRADWHPPAEPSDAERAWPLFHAAQLVGVQGRELHALGDADAARWLERVERYGELERRRLLHLAFERSYDHGVLAALVAAPRARTATQPARAQVITCIDEREESLRRHLEEGSTDIETFGLAGFFGVAMYFLGLDDAHARPLCPVAVQPTHEVRELPRRAPHAAAELLRSAHRRLALGAHGLGVGSRTLVRGAFITAVAGILSAIPLVLRVLFPRWAARLRRRGRAALRPRVPTTLALERSTREPTQGAVSGFTPPEMAAIVARALEDIGLTKRFAPLVLVLGHGSTSLNNPQESAHDCGACGGGHGGPNARAFAAMANHPEVRRLLARQAITLPTATWFVGGEHNTCHDGIELYDLDRAPAEAEPAIAALRRDLERARRADAHERCRRFASAPSWLSPALALAHVEGRAQDLAQPRPEYGHATAACCIIGRRQRTRGLFLDRRAFLVSYDPTHDPSGDVLSRLLSAVIPVVAGISLEYYFGVVDNIGYGCGTKLPHNVSALLGVMDGHAGDLRPGLPWQMVEIHEPMRLLVVVEAPVERLAAAVASDPQLERLVVHRWLRLLALDPASGRLFEHAGHELTLDGVAGEPPVATSSVAWYGGRRGHLPIARVSAP